MKQFRLAALSILFCTTLHAVDNPVVEIYDGCIMRFGGRFYAMGTGTDGGIYHSKDMIRWEGPVQAANTAATWLNNPEFHERGVYRRIGAGDIVYHNGLFHLYYNGIGHQVATRPLGPYTETSLNEPFCVYGIDPQLYIEPDGQLIFLRKVQTKNPLSMERWTRPKATFMFPLQTPFSYGDNPFTGDRQGIMLNCGQKGRNDHIDKNNFEGGELYRYRGQYYLLNSGSCMSARTGLYNGFCTQSPSLDEMGNEDKYPHEVLTRNLEELHLKYRVLAPMSDFGPWEGRINTGRMPEDWMHPRFDDSEWTLQSMGLGAPAQDRDVAIRHVRTLWRPEWKQVHIRRSFTVEEPPEKPLLLYRSENPTVFYLNGKKLFEDDDRNDNRGWQTRAIPADVFVTGRNVLAVRTEASRGDRYLDVGVYDAGSGNVEDPVIGPSQINLLLGPNGFEHMAVYKAFWNGDSAQGVDRVFFYDRELVMDGPTTSTTAGYHPNPSMPSLQENLNELPSEKKWEYKPAVWKILPDGRMTSKTAVAAMISQPAASQHLMETTFALPKDGRGSAGVIVWFKDMQNFTEILISRSRNSWTVNHVIEGRRNASSYPLPDRFFFFEPNTFVTEQTPAMHELRVYRNGTDLQVWLDHFNLTTTAPVPMQTDEPGRTGIVQYGGEALFGHLLYTRGWDEYGEHITGWEGAEAAWQRTEDGIALAQSVDRPDILKKGDALTHYSFECNVKNPKLPSDGRVMFFPLWIDRDNHLAAVYDYAEGHWTVTERRNGQELRTQTITPTNGIRRVHQFEPPYTGPANEYVYELRGESMLSHFKLLWMEGRYPYINADFGLPQKVEVEYRTAAGRWRSAPNLQAGPQRFSVYNDFRFDPVQATALRIKCQGSADGGPDYRPYHIEALIDRPATFFFRAVRSGDQVRLFFNQTLLGEWSSRLPASRTAIGSMMKDCFFSGIMRYENCPIDQQP